VIVERIVLLYFNVNQQGVLYVREDETSFIKVYLKIVIINYKNLTFEES